MDKNILIVIDCQNDFIDGCLGSKDAQEAVPNIIKKINEFSNGVIITTQDTHGDNYMETSEGKSLPVPHCIQYTSGWQINKDILENIQKNISDGDLYVNIEKPTFGSYELANVVKSYVDSTDDNINIEILGFCTDICVISNALLLKAILFNSNNVKVSVIENCCAGVTKEKHNAALEVMKSCQIEII